MFDSFANAEQLDRGRRGDATQISRGRLKSLVMYLLYCPYLHSYNFWRGRMG